MRKKAFIKTLPVMAGYVFLGFAFGLLMKTKGYPIWYPVLMSIAIYSGALEFAAVPLLSESFSLPGAFAFGFLLSARHLFYGLPLLKRFKNTGVLKPFLIFGLTDETFSILLSDAECDKGYMAYVTLFDYMYWVTGTLLGAVFGNVITFDLEGLDFALTALFIVLLINSIKSKNDFTCGLIGLGASLLALLTVGTDNMIITAMPVIVILLFALKGRLKNEQW